LSRTRSSQESIESTDSLDAFDYKPRKPRADVQQRGSHHALWGTAAIGCCAALYWLVRPFEQPPTPPPPSDDVQSCEKLQFVSARAAYASTAEVRALLIGDVFTLSHGLVYVYRDLIAAAMPNAHVEVELAPALSLDAAMWPQTSSRRSAHGRWTHVVLQERDRLVRRPSGSNG
jgi:hypothetical protein